MSVRRRFYSRTDAYRIKKPVWACLHCGWFTQDGKTRDCLECHRPCEHFDSEGEYCEYKRLQLMQQCGEISDLERQVRYDICGINVHTGKPVQIFFYKADFRYRDKKGNVIVRDYKPEVKKTKNDPKGERALSPEFKLKRRAMRLIHDIEVQV